MLYIHTEGVWRGRYISNINICLTLLLSCGICRSFWLSCLTGWIPLRSTSKRGLSFLVFTGIYIVQCTFAKIVCIYNLKKLNFMTFYPVFYATFFFFSSLFFSLSLHFYFYFPSGISHNKYPIFLWILSELLKNESLKKKCDL